MNFLKSLFGGSGEKGDPNAMYVYVRPKRCEEVLRVRIDMRNDPSLNDDGDGYYVRKLASAVRCPFQSEVEIYFDRKKNVIDKQVTNGEFATEEDFMAYEAEKAGS